MSHHATHATGTHAEVSPPQSPAVSAPWQIPGARVLCPRLLFLSPSVLCVHGCSSVARVSMLLLLCLWRVAGDEARGHFSSHDAKKFQDRSVRTTAHRRIGTPSARLRVMQRAHGDALLCVYCSAAETSRSTVDALEPPPARKKVSAQNLKPISPSICCDAILSVPHHCERVIVRPCVLVLCCRRWWWQGHVGSSGR
jgi:hypothetical protein